MSIPDWAATVSSVVAILASFWAIHRFITKALIRDYLSELKPNGGSSVKDSVSRLERQVEEIYRILLNRNNS